MSKAFSPSAEKSFARRTGRLCSRFVRSRSGIAAVEAAVIAPVFILFVSGVAEVSAMMLTMRMLDHATEAAARRVRMGDITTRAGSAAQFKQSFCDALPGFTDCANQLSVKAVAAADLPGLTSALASATATPASPSFNPGLPESFVAVEAKLDWPSFSPLFSNLTPTLVTFQSRAVFRNEPFPASQTGSGT
jgi:Flp pilus assembly protein TadG